MRDITLEDTFYHHFTTRQFSDGVPTTLAGTPALSVVEDNNATPITAGVSVAADHASVTGLNLVTIVATAANGYESGKSYSIYISTGTVGGVSVVGEVVGHFTIEASAAAVDLANVTDGLGAIKTETAAILVDTGTTLENHLTDIKGTSFVKDTHSLIDIEGYVDILDDATNGNAAIKTDTAAILLDTATTIPAQISGLNNVAATDIVSGGAITTSAGAVSTVTTVGTTTTNTDMRGTDSAALASVCTEGRLAELDAANLPSDVDTIVTLTGTTLPAQISGLNDISVADVLTTQMTEAYAADGVAPTLAQALFLIQQSIGDFAISGTTLTVKKLDGSTTAATYTLDDGTDPTSRTRAT